MGDGIEIQLNIQPQVIDQSPEQPPADVVLSDEYQSLFSGNENGAIFFNLDWQNQQADERKYTLTTILDANSTQTFSARATAQSGWENLVQTAKQSDDFKEFENQPEKFWQQVRQMSETGIVRTDNGNETPTVSQFDELVLEMQTRKLSPQEFAETLPPNEKNVFKARYQLQATFGENIFKADGVTLSENGQMQIRKFSAENNSAAHLPESASENQLASLPKRATEEMIFAPKTPTRFGANNTVYNEAASGNKNSPVNTSQTAFGSTSILPENTPARSLSNANSANSTTASAAANRSNSAVLGGALISGAFNLIDNYKHFEKNEIKDSRAKANAFSRTGIGFSAGATGTIFSAAIGSVVSNSESVVSGVLGFVSGVVAGTAVEQGLRLLGTEGIISAAANSQARLTIGDADTQTGLTLQPAFA